jgi:hypothetical protein
MAFLQVLTRCYRRPRMLWRNIKSLEAQSDNDYIQSFLVDGEGRGVGAAQASLANFAAYVRGQYIWILDDDDHCIDIQLIADLKSIAGAHNPDVIMVRMDHGGPGAPRILPDDGHWPGTQADWKSARVRPVLSYAGCSAYVVRRAVWQRHAGAFGSARYTSDFDFIDAVFADDPAVYWHNVIASQVQWIGLGRPE